MRQNIKRPASGFTLIELLIVISIITALISVSVMSFSSLGRRMALDNASSKVQQLIYFGRQLSMNRKIEHRVVFFEDRVCLWSSQGGFLDRDQRPIDIEEIKRLSPEVARQELGKHGIMYGQQVTCVLGYKPGEPEPAPEWNIANVSESPDKIKNHSIGFKMNGEIDFFGYTSVPRSALKLDTEEEKPPTGADLIFVQRRSPRKSYVDIDSAGGKITKRIYETRGNSNER